MTTTQASEIISDPFVSIHSDAELTPREHEYYFGSLLTKNVSGIVFLSLKEEDDDNYEFFHRNVKSWVEKNGLNIYFLRVGFHISKKSDFRTRMSLRKEIATTHLKDLVKFEVDGQNGTSRLAVIGPLTEELGLMSLEALLNWVYSIVIVSELEIGQIAQRAEAWVNTRKSSPLGFDFSCVLRDLERDPTSAICRFFPNDNGRPAALSIVFGRK